MAEEPTGKYEGWALVLVVPVATGQHPYRAILLLEDRARSRSKRRARYAYGDTPEDASNALLRAYKQATAFRPVKVFLWADPRTRRPLTAGQYARMLELAREKAAKERRQRYGADVYAAIGKLGREKAREAARRRFARAWGTV